jgi:hypothetical protein
MLPSPAKIAFKVGSERQSALALPIATRANTAVLDNTLIVG